MTVQVRLSKFKIGDLALRSAWELERARSRLNFNREPLRQLAEALEKSSDVGASQGAVVYMRPGYFEPLERVYRVRHSSEPESLEGVQRFVQDATISLKKVVADDASSEVSGELVDFCLELHRAFIRRVPAEGRHEHTNCGIPTEALVS
jgi:hypothetical protein